jgi:hypothetical protein
MEALLGATVVLNDLGDMASLILGVLPDRMLHVLDFLLVDVGCCV